MCISERLRQVCEAKNWKITDFAEQTGIAYRTMQGYIGGEREPNAEGMTGIAKAGVNLNWLVSGEGEMFLSDVKMCIRDSAKPKRRCSPPESGRPPSPNQISKPCSCSNNLPKST